MNAREMIEEEMGLDSSLGMYRVVGLLNEGAVTYWDSLPLKDGEKAEDGAIYFCSYNGDDDVLRGATLFYDDKIKMMVIMEIAELVIGKYERLIESVVQKWAMRREKVDKLLSENATTNSMLLELVARGVVGPTGEIKTEYLTL